ncbi:MAG: ABC transporter permease [Henriciella sp.]|nr:ABC transporter permease [Hyphomonadaceae bacterium]
MAFWRHLAHQDMTLQYARSAIGPFWITLTMALQLVALTYLFTGLFGAPVEIIAPWVTIGVIIWTLMSASLSESASVLSFNKSYLMEAETSISGFVMSIVIKNVMIAAHHSILIVLLFIWLAISPSWAWAWVLLSLPLIIVFTTGLGIALAIFAARFRDVKRVTESFLMIGFFLTPVLWRPQELVKNEFVATYNPFTHLIAIVRQPLLGQTPDALAWTVSIYSTVIVLALALYSIARYRTKVPFWL